MAAASLIGFGLVVVAVSMFTSLLFGGVLLLLKPRLRTAGPWAERRAAAIALVLPPAVGLGVSATIAATKLLSFAAGQDHCLGHSHHLHLCPIHGTHWLSAPWAAAAVAFFAAFLLVRLGQTAWGHVRAQQAALQLRRAGQPVSQLDCTFIVPSEEPFAFTAGIFSPTVVISRPAWDSLDESQRQAVLAHEHAHLAHGDLWQRAVLGLLSCFGVPVLSRTALDLWEAASERACDREAAKRVGRPSIVASAILSLAQARSLNRVTAPAAAVFAASCHVSDRVHSLFDQPQSGRPAARRLLGTLLWAAAAAALGCALFAESLHHVLETILG